MASLVAVLVVLTGCGGGGGPYPWRDLTLAIPEGWSVFEEADTRLGLSNVALAELDQRGDAPSGDVIAVSLMAGPGADPGSWRRDASERGITVEEDRATEVGGLPATRFVLLDDTTASPRRELVVLVPSRSLTLIATPVTRQDASDGPEVFDRAAPTIEELVASISWGAPVEDDPGPAS